MKTTDIRSLVYCALCAALIAVCSWLSIPATVPFTLQTFAVFAVLLLLGGKLGLQTVAVYILLGAVGVPVFSGFTGGIGILLGTTGGYIIGFIFMALVYWVLEKWVGTTIWKQAVVLLLGLAVCYAFGTVWFMTVYARKSGAIALATALGWCVIPFILPDCGKLALALVLAGRLKKLVLHGKL